MDRFVSKRSSSSVDLNSSSRDDVRAERAAIALSVGLSWPPDRYTKQTRSRPSWQQLLERALQDHILDHHELPHSVRWERPASWRPGEAIDQPLTHEELAHTKTRRAATAAPATPAAALVEDEPSGSGSKRQVDPIAREWFLDMLDLWRRERRWDMQRSTLPRDVRRDQPEHSVPLQAERATNRDARQENFAVARRHDTAKRAHYAGDRRPVPQRGDNQRLGARMARRTGARRPSWARVGQASLGWPRSPPSA